MSQLGPLAAHPAGTGKATGCTVIVIMDAHTDAERPCAGYGDHPA